MTLQIAPDGLQQLPESLGKTETSGLVVPLAAKTDELCDDERALLASFRSLGEEDKQRLLRFIEGLELV